MPTNDILPQIILNEGHNKELTPYLMFKYAIKTEITRKYYERSIMKEDRENFLNLLNSQLQIWILKLNATSLQKKQRIIQIGHSIR